MKNYILSTVILLFTLQSVKSQSDYSEVENTLQNYINGSSYNKLDVLESAFTKNATLYLTAKKGFKVFTPKEYVAFFKNNEPGKFNGRNGKVLAVELVQDIATAKVEISIPKREMVYIDLFLLKKTNNGWKIISKTATKMENL
ncbi:nuclear transport factor 2 family protein [Aquimarina sediminis]|uniref:nuclear transport factor 2 family protein n=1 Tax=Aquimarina sediminis TaxID=2070536 RepID=UPI000CA029D2|nr:nuclear transport factor 2 family protein [Aquimarina sediminis]